MILGPQVQVPEDSRSCSVQVDRLGHSQGMGSLETRKRVLRLIRERRHKEETAEYQDGPNCKRAQLNGLLHLPHFTLTA